MKYDETKIWSRIASTGLFVTSLALITAILQYGISRRFTLSLFMRYLPLCMNTVAFLGFIYLVTSPRQYIVYAVILYVYGVGNLLDGGNVLGALCITTCIAFMFIAGLLDKHRNRRIVILSILPAVALLMQLWTAGYLQFFMSLMHIAGSSFLVTIIYLLFYPRFKELEQHKSSYTFTEKDCLEYEVEWLRAVIRGEKYSVIAQRHGVSESKVKARILELYRILNVHDKTEFLTAYHNYEFCWVDSRTLAPEE